MIARSIWYIAISTRCSKAGSLFPSPREVPDDAALRMRNDKTIFAEVQVQVIVIQNIIPMAGWMVIREIQHITLRFALPETEVP